VLTWRSRRYEGALRYRPLDLEEATAITRHAIVQDGTQGMFRIRIVLYLFVSPFHIPFLMRPSHHRPSTLPPLLP
jgi:hypothetical protein